MWGRRGVERRRDAELATTKAARVQAKTRDIMDAMRQSKFRDEKEFLKEYSIHERTLFEEVRRRGR